MPGIPQIYDISLDDFRPVTQQDISRFGELTKSWGRVCDGARGGLSEAELRELIDSEQVRLMEVSRHG